MPENREDEVTQQLLRDVQARLKGVEDAVRLLAQSLVVRVAVRVDANESGRTTVYPLFPQELSPEQWTAIFHLASKAWPSATEQEAGASPWQHLVARPHPWRKQLCIKGRNMTVRHLVGTVKANNLTPEQAAEDLGLPVDAIREALHYAEKYSHLLESEAAYERHLLAQGGYRRGAQPVP